MHRKKKNSHLTTRSSLRHFGQQLLDLGILLHGMGTHVSISAARLRSICVVRAASAISATRLAAARSSLRASWYAFLVSSSAKSRDFSSSTLASDSLAVFVSRVRYWEMDFPISIAFYSCSAALCLCRTAAASTSCTCCCCSCCICFVSEIHRTTLPTPPPLETSSGHEALIFLSAPSSPARSAASSSS